MSTDATPEMEPAPSKRWQKIEALFVAALDVPAGARGTFLDTACDDALLHAEVVRLLAAHDAAEGFLENLDAGQAAALIEAVEKPFEAGHRVGPYRLLRELGRGGMGRVYVAEDTRLDRQVALKFLPPHLATDERAKQRLTEEAKAASALDHPGIAVVHEMGETADGQLFIAMAYYEGETLRHKIERGPLPVEEATDLTRQMAEALAAAHARGIVHRDVKPGNIIVLPAADVPSAQEVAKLVDFGIAKPRGTPLTTTGATPGTVAYMSPEQTRGEAVDARTDLWSLGVVLYEMLTGERPFEGEHEQTLIYAIRHDAPKPVRSLRPEVPAALAQAVEKLLRKDPARRYHSAGALLADLKALENGMLPSRPSDRLKKPALLYAGLAAVFVLLLAGVRYAWPARDGSDTADTATETAQLPRTRLAVLPLDNLSPDPEDAYFADGLTEELISRLSKLGGLQVIARTSVMPYKNTDKSIAEIGQELGVGTILEGSVRKASDQVRITVQLIDAQTEEHLWTESYDGELENVLAVQSRVAQQVAEASHVQMQAREQYRLAKKGTDHPEAYTLYLKGRYFWNKRTAAWFKKSMEYFQQALDLDPTYAQAWAGLADVYLMLGSVGERSPEEAHAMARTAAERALAIDNDLAEAHTTLATIHADRHDWKEAKQHFQRALAANPSYALAHQRYALYLAVTGQFSRAIQAAYRAQALDPLSVYASAGAGYVLYLARQYDEAIGHLHKTREMDPTFYLSYLDLGLVYVQKRMYEEAISAFEKGVALSGGEPNVQGLLGYAYAVSGRKDEAKRVLDELDERSREQHISPFHKAIIYIGLGEKARALMLLEQAYEERTWLITLLKVEPLFDPLRSEPRFQALLKKVGLSE